MKSESNLQDQIINHKLAFISVIAAAVCGGAIPVFSKIGLFQIPPVTFTFLRFALASLFLLPLVIKERPKITKDILPVIIISLLATANVTLFSFGIKLTTATTGQLLHTGTPLIALVLSYFLLREKISSTKLLGILVGFIGVITIITLPVINKGSAFNGSLIGNILIATGALSFSIYSVYSKRYQIKMNISPILLSFIFTLTTAIVLSIFSVKEYILQPSWIQHVSVESYLAVLYVGSLGGAVFYALYQYAIKHGTPVIASMILFLQPVATFLWAFTLLGERLTLGIIIGGVLAFVGAYIVTLKK